MLRTTALARWRREYEQGKFVLTDGKDVSLLAVCVDGTVSTPERSIAASSSRATREAAVSVELHLPKGKVVIHGVDAQQLRRLIEAMQ
jgi:transposase-like protein